MLACPEADWSLSLILLNDTSMTKNHPGMKIKCPDDKISADGACTVTVQAPE